VVATVYKRADGKTNAPVSDEQVGKLNGLGYNPATQAKGFTTEQAKRTVSQKDFSDWALGDTQTKVQARF
jgi:sterol carrier protein 2